MAAKKPMVKIAPSKKGTFTAAAKKSGMTVQQKASQVLGSPSASPAIRKKAQFAKNAAGWSKGKSTGKGK